MKKNRFDQHRSVHEIAQGSYTGQREPTLGQQPNFTRMVVLDVISDPYIIDDKKIAYWEHTLKVQNIRFVKSLPRNTIIGLRMLDGSNPSSDLPMFVFPFFPSHLALPCKAGEHVWVMFEHADARYTEMGYWFCRIAEPHHVDDVNHTHPPRQFDPSFVVSTKDAYGGSAKPTYEFRNGAVDVADGQRYVAGGTAFIAGPEDAYEQILDNSDAGQITQHEAVPRFRKRPGDLVLEGSNNTSIVLGTDRKAQLANYSEDTNKGKVSKPTSDIQKSAGSIDMVAGRGQTDTTSGSRVKSKRLTGGDYKEELGKGPTETIETEGNPDFKNDRSRVLIAQKTLADANFELASFNEAEFNISDDPDGTGAIVLKTDKLRLIARSEMQILVPGQPTKDANGNLVENSDQSTWASIVVRSNGDIVFLPSARGVVKLGGDDANLTPLCGRAITGAGDGTGLVTAGPIIDSMMGSQGGGGVSGEFPTKVLIK